MQGYVDFKTQNIQKMTCNIVLSKNLLLRKEDIETIRACFLRDVSMYMEMLKQELTYSVPKFLLSDDGLVRFESDREKEIIGEIQKVRIEYSDKYAPYISF